MTHEQAQGCLYLMLFLGAVTIGVLVSIAVALNQIVTTLRKR